MLGRTHRAFGVAAGSLCLLAIDHGMSVFTDGNTIRTTCQFLIAEATLIMGSSLPDIDQILGTAHRGITHAIWIPLILFCLAFNYKDHIYLFPAILSLALAYFLHLVGDAFSKAGIAWFYPFQRYQRYGNGAFIVKGFRGPFLPLYRVGDETFSFMVGVWVILGVIAAVTLWMQIVR